MTLFGEIMNIPVAFSRGEFKNEAEYLRYKEGHRDARHEAAQIATEGDRAIQLLSEIGDYYLDEIQSEDLVEKIKAFMEQR